MEIVSERAFRSQEAMRLWFHAIYPTRSEYLPELPTPFLVEAVNDMEPDLALDVSMGYGRNSISLAGIGWDVTGFDVSEEAHSTARDNAGKAGVKVDAILAGDQDFDFANGKWDLVAMMYALFSIRDPASVRRLCDSLRPGGRLVIQLIWQLRHARTCVQVSTAAGT